MLANTIHVYRRSEFLLTILVVHVEQSVQCVCLSVLTITFK